MTNDVVGCVARPYVMPMFLFFRGFRICGGWWW